MTLQTSNNILSLHKNRLSVQASLSGLSFLVTDSNKENVLFFEEKKFSQSLTPEELLFEIETTIQQNEILQSQFADVLVVYENDIFTTVPSSLFDDTKASEYLKFNSKILANDFIAHDILDTYGIVVVYVPYININNFIIEKYGTFQYFHAISVFVKMVLETEKHSENPKVYLRIQNDSFDCVVVKNGQLQLVNNYPFKTPEDFCYYVLFCLEQLKLNPDKIEVLLSGAISKEDPIFKNIYTYIRNISFFEYQSSKLILPNQRYPHNNILIKSIA
jgi:hypothetical protein